MSAECEVTPSLGESATRGREREQRNLPLLPGRPWGRLHAPTPSGKVRRLLAFVHVGRGPKLRANAKVPLTVCDSFAHGRSFDSGLIGAGRLPRFTEIPLCRDLHLSQSSILLKKQSKN